MFSIIDKVDWLDQQEVEIEEMKIGEILGKCLTNLLPMFIVKRLFTTVRHSLGLTYDVSFELNLFDRLKLGWYMISVTSTPSKVHKAVDACKNVLRGLHSNKITERELDRNVKIQHRSLNRRCVSTTPGYNDA
ncbi:hypothetical protein JHK85_045345 [Glycine max]|nr:hypothetical protein JHK86_044733 [Glycine max]KAG4951478.1 hypothetical protein JHK85_045345 [Glycine max]